MPGRACRCTASASMLAARDRMPGAGRRGPAPPTAAEVPGPDTRLGGLMAAPATSSEILDVNRRYHDAAAREYDAKWGISFGEIGRRQVLGKVRKLLGARPGPFPRALEIGAGTGYFSLNLTRSEEHTSELQSPCNLVCRLLLEKKN